MRRERDTKITLIKGVAALLLCVIAVSAVAALSRWEMNRETFSALQINEPQKQIEYNGKTYVLKKDVETFLVMGLDKFGEAFENDAYTNNRQADFQMLFVFDNKNKKISAIHINRDTFTEINVLGVAGQKIDTVEKQLALAHTYGNGGDVSCRNTADAVSNLLLGTKVDHYMSVTMDSVPVYNDLVGGVELVVLDDFTGIDETLIKGKNVTLHGKQVLNYVQDRYGLDDSTNNARMARQRQYLQALYEKTRICAENDDTFIQTAAMAMSDYIVSDRSVSQLEKLAKNFLNYEFDGIRHMEGESVMGEKFIEFYPDESSVREIVTELFYEEEK